MKITVVQSALTWEDKQANLLHFDKKMYPLRGKTDLVVLPELFATGFSMNTGALAEEMSGKTVGWMRIQAMSLDAVIVGSFICREGGKFFNRLVWMRPDGTFETYDKRHLFSLAGEDAAFSPGEKRLTVEYKGMRIRPMVCYDLRFPVWSRNEPEGAEGYDLAIYIANWPVRRAHHWRSLLQARAIENQAFVAGVNIVGTDGNGLEYVGDSTILDFSGQPMRKISSRTGNFTAELSLDALKQWRQQFPFLRDGDQFEIGKLKN